MTSEQIDELTRRRADAFNRHDVNALCGDYTEDGVVVSPMFSRVQGRAELCGTFAALFAAFPDWQLVFDAPIVDGNRVAVQFSVRATHQGEFMGIEGTGRKCEFAGVSLFEISDDLKIKEERRFYDFTGLLTRLGVLRVKPA